MKNHDFPNLKNNNHNKGKSPQRKKTNLIELNLRLITENRGEKKPELAENL